MSGTSLVYWNDKFGKGIARCDEFLFEITGAKTVAPLIPGQPGLVFFDAVTQAQIDAELKSSSEFAVAKFDATAMGDDMFGMICNFGGQMEKLVACKFELHTSADANEDTLASVMVKDSGLTDSTAATEATVSSNGNLGVRFLADDLVDGATVLDLDGATAGYIKLSVYWVSK